MGARQRHEVWSNSSSINHQFKLLTEKSVLELLQNRRRYEVITYTSDIRGAGTDANVTCILFGEQGQTPATKLENSKNNFERGQVRGRCRMCRPIKQCGCGVCAGKGVGHLFTIAMQLGSLDVIVWCCVGAV